MIIAVRELDKRGDGWPRRTRWAGGKGAGYLHTIVIIRAVRELDKRGGGWPRRARWAGRRGKGIYTRVL